MKKVFTGATQKEVGHKADEWWASQNGLRLKARTQVATGDEGLSLKDADRWTATIHYDEKNSD